MKRTASPPSGRLWFWLWLGVISALVVVVLWLGTKHDFDRELETRERFFEGAVRVVEGIVRNFQEELGEASRGRFEHLAVAIAWREDPLLGAVLSPAHGGSTLSWPPTLKASLEKVEALLPPGRGWALVEEGEWGARGVVALRISKPEVRGALLLELPKLLLVSFASPPAGGPLVVWLVTEEGSLRFFSCELQRGAPGEWTCFPQRKAPFDHSAELLIGRRTQLAEGISLGKRVWVGSESIAVGLFVPTETLGSFSAAWVALVALWAFLVGSAVVAWRHWSALEARNVANQAHLSRQEAELSARIAEAQWRVLMENVKEPLLFLRDDLVVRANEAAARLFGYEHRADLLGRPLGELLAPEERERVKKLLPAATLASGAFTTHVVGENGRRRTVEVRPSALETGGESLICLSLQDYTSRERLEKLLRAVCSAIHAGVAFLDPRGAVAWCNTALAEALGVKSEELQGSNLLVFVVPDSRREVRRAFLRALRGESAHGEARCRLKGDAIAHVEVEFRSVRVAGAVTGVVLVAQRLGSASTKWSAAEESSVPTHDLVMYYVHRLANAVQAPLAKEPRGRSAALVLRESLAQVAELVHQLALLFRLHGAGLSVVELNELVVNLKAELESLVPPQVRLVLRPWSGPAPVRCDPEQVHLFLRGAVEASVECLRGGAGTVEVSVERPGSGFFRLAVSDTGEVRGAYEEAQGLLPARLRARAMAHCVARRHRGQAGFRERAGFGARVWVDLAPAVVESVEPGEGKPAVGKVLVVDDEPSIREGLAQLLRGEGYEVLLAADGREALAVFDAEPDRIALVVLDLVMPEMDGREVYAELMRRNNPPQVLLCTGYDPGHDPALASARVLVKPFTVEAFLETVRRMVAPRSQ